MHTSDEVRLRHMLDAASEAASRVTETGRAQLPELPWVEIVGMRNRLIHAYWDTDLDIVWKTASDEMPVLVAMLEPLVPPARE